MAKKKNSLIAAQSQVRKTYDALKLDDAVYELLKELKRKGQ